MLQPRPPGPVRSDWHVHTHLSDGCASPEQVVEAAVALGLERLAITDHDCIAAHRAGRARAAARGRIEIVAGVEIDCLLEGGRIEILGLGFDPENEALGARLAEVQADRRRRFLFYCERLREAGEPADPEPWACGPSLALLKVHIYRALESAGRIYPGGYREFTARLEGLGAPPPVRTPEAAEAARLILQAGGRVLLAHPLYYHERPGLETLLRAAREFGCAGVEYLYPYDFGPRGWSRDAAAELFGRLDALLLELFPPEAERTQGTDVHEPGEWPARLDLLRDWARRLDRPLR
ncbi:MAG: PHP domain-containing protein [Candidatus Eisenbacteria bacterium]|uniref:PHP domain-containing protein n=1 Tax=Eiseniibacteriota bacterium TaxID=2212470 RepID=A0A937X7S1_UNCEI|nr:PHP domain-containing protein [Candidatus Eisenbacteria bacterium]